MRGSIGGTVVIKTDSGHPALFDMDTGKQVTSAYNGLVPLGLGLFITKPGDYLGNGVVGVIDNSKLKFYTSDKEERILGKGRKAVEGEGQVYQS